MSFLEPSHRYFFHALYSAFPIVNTWEEFFLLTLLLINLVFTQANCVTELSMLLLCYYYCCLIRANENHNEATGSSHETPTIQLKRKTKIISLDGSRKHSQDENCGIDLKESNSDIRKLRFPKGMFSRLKKKKNIYCYRLDCDTSHSKN